MFRTRVKICGITRPEDAIAAAAAGADAIGLVFYSGSTRAVDIATAQQIVAVLPPFVTAVGLFVNAAPDMVADVLQRVPLGLLQFHGEESPDYCTSFGQPFIKAVPMGATVDVMAYAERFAAASGLLLDSHTVGEIGGSGKRFDWQLIPQALTKPLILAGGLDPDNVATALAHRPYGVDVSSGVEIAKGIKSHDRMVAFLRVVHNAV